MRPSSSDQRPLALDREDREQPISTLATNPHAGDLIPGLGGVRKLRWAPAGRSKRGAFRVIYYVLNGSQPILALLLYAKNEQSDVSPEQRKVILRLVEQLKGSRRWRRIRSSGGS